MPWEQQFDHDRTVDRAMEAFWARGYEAVSMQQLVDCMGINRASIYATYGNKRSLFIQALRSYDKSYRDAWLKTQARKRTARRAIISVFDEIIEATIEGGNRRGCFLVNTALELSPHDEEISSIVAQGLRETEGFFREMIDRGQVSGEIRKDLDADQAAQALLGLLTGLRVLSRSRPERPLLRALADQAAHILA